jgi:pimeloyl-ACP methyl ester carboxylesterase
MVKLLASAGDNMTHAQHKTVQCLSPAGLHTMAYKVWGDPLNPNVLLCLHGVTRVSDDFDNMGMALSDTYRVLCPDVVGRGRSDWLRDPQYYVLPQYASDMVTLLARLNAETVDCVGTSMGGLIGIVLASLRGTPLRKLVLNDVGPALNVAALARIGAYIGQPLRFTEFEQLAAYIREISATFGPHSEPEWRKLASDVARQDVDGQWILHYDPALALPLRAATTEAKQHAEAMMWGAYDAITCPTMLLRGAESDLLTPEVAHAMTQRGAKARLVELAGVGHAPTLIHADQIGIVKDFLLAQIPPLVSSV